MATLSQRSEEELLARSLDDLQYPGPSLAQAQEIPRSCLPPRHTCGFCLFQGGLPACGGRPSNWSYSVHHFEYNQRPTKSSFVLAHSLLAFPLFSLSAFPPTAPAASWEMRLFLVRHGETVDNVAGLYAGIRDSPLTAHGVLQARRLGEHLAKYHRVTHVFSSDLQRAVDTAVKVVDAQLSRRRRPDEDYVDVPESTEKLKPLQLVDLRERDFRSAEGKKFGTPHGDAETHEQMRLRAARFVQRHLVPLLTGEGPEIIVVVVAHGLILNSLSWVLQARFGTEPRGFETSAAWSNTGYLEAVVKATAADMEASTAETSGDRKTTQRQFTLTVVGVNVLRHLGGLKKTKGGIGNAQFDKRQRTMDSFFGPASKKARVDQESGKS
ncbi:histidine phosphatase superfamily [Triangularia setosa]|uniref:Histidine phosphatase superfamily n=1 Tax=Triangularia setosa TaxID=2587417 RepID=A0AAN7A993_9PEZI|nr:histidine phosphatase superfamily [Podospora setosa]